MSLHVSHGLPSSGSCTALVWLHSLFSGSFFCFEFWLLGFDRACSRSGRAQHDGGSFRFRVSLKAEACELVRRAKTCMYRQAGVGRLLFDIILLF